MFGKYFASCYTGSMVGSGLAVFAVWGYVVANTRTDGTVELNPVVLAAILGCTAEEVEGAIHKLLQPDPKSRSQKEKGRRLIQRGPFLFFVPTYDDYRRIRDDADRREYMRNYMRDYRADSSPDVNPVNTSVNNGEPVNTPVSTSKPPLAQAEAEADTETTTPTTTDVSSKKDTTLQQKAILDLLKINRTTMFQSVAGWEAMMRGMTEGLGTPGGVAVSWEVLREAAEELAAAGGDTTPHRYKIFVSKVLSRSKPGGATAGPAKKTGGRTMAAAELMQKVRSFRDPMFPNSLFPNWAESVAPPMVGFVRTFGIQRILNDQNEGTLLAQLARAMEESGL